VGTTSISKGDIMNKRILLKTGNIMTTLDRVEMIKTLKEALEEGIDTGIIEKFNNRQEFVLSTGTAYGKRISVRALLRLVEKVDICWSNISLRMDNWNKPSEGSIVFIVL
jgi:hypothetical protein